MKKKIPINRYSWSAAVREYDVIHNGKTNKEESWNKIRERLDRQPRRKRIAWYWIAAASLVLFFAIRLFFTGGNDETNLREYTVAPKILKERRKMIVPDSIQAATKAPVKVSDPAIKRRNNVTNDGLPSIIVKKGSVQPEPGDSMYNAVNDTQSLVQDIVQEPAPLPKVHINDLTTEPLPKDVSTKSLGVKKMIRLFGSNITIIQAAKQPEKIPANQYTIPNNQN